MNNKIGIIPTIEDIDTLNALSLEKDLFFEYNDFFIPTLLDDEAELESRIEAYLAVERDRSQDTMHGVFFDINPATDDPLLFQVIDRRVRSSVDIAKRLGVKGVVFHTNYITSFKLKGYRLEWVKRCTDYYCGLLEENKGLYIYIENMFDESPELLTRLAENLHKYDNFGVCLDFAHARVFGHDPKAFCNMLAPYVRHMHINDNTGLFDDHMPLGEGNTNWALFSSLMEQNGLNREDVSVLIELRGLERINSSIRYMEENL